MENESLIDDFIKSFNDKVEFDTIIKSGVETRFVLNTVESSLFTKTIHDIFQDADVVSNKVTINLNKCKFENCYFFHDIKDYLINFDRYKNAYLESDIVILRYQGTTLWKHKNEDFSQEKALVFNFPIYNEVFDFFKMNSLFTTFYSPIKNEIIILNKDNGAFHIGYKNLEEKVSLLSNLQPLIEILKTNFVNKEFVQFFKENITVIGIGNFDPKERFLEILKNLNPIILLTERDYENYVRDFNFENIKTKFKEERNKYFEGLEKNIGLVNKQVLSIPLTFAATAFASYQVKDKPLIVLLILIAFILYSIIAFKMLGISKFNIQCINEDVNKEEQEIKDNYSKNYVHFKEDFDKIRLKITKIEYLMSLIGWVLQGMLALFFLFSVFQYFNNEEEQKESISIPLEKIKYISVDSVATIKKDTSKIITSSKKSNITNQATIPSKDSIQY
ncbi:hypothetical protein GKZ90_0001115 [Flavobacterium sp. MC2016-06]|jgi:hypothetical protein|uniref:hypothetical protein n=1 Tax=Flavobacterium sp. MC2016-06 TaxID=2676308 RepID=UPI0012BAB366|nr:hypothetical protein [Flavobacterium sp. MC2016-06]MBU3859089.1 hypothetical protein [Flavobacterium sp. MC2016-06]